MNRNQVAVLNFLNAWEKYHPFTAPLLRAYARTPEDKIYQLNAGWLLMSPTWQNQLKQATILLQEVNRD